MDRIDWEQLYERLVQAQAALQRSLEPGAEARRRVLEERARRLAREAPALAEREEIEIVEFLLADEIYGVESRYVLEILPLKELTPIPCTPAFVAGVINVRSRIFSVIDLRRFFNLPAKGLTELNKVMLLRSGEMELGLLLDAVRGVRRIAVDEMEEAPATVGGIGGEYLRGVTAEPIMIVSAEKILADRRLIVEEEVDVQASNPNEAETT